MTTSWTADQVIGLAPDPASAKAGRGLAAASKWELVGADERMVWGACKGSAAAPYQTVIDQQGPTFACSCPSRKFPCKHGLGLLLLLAAEPQRFSAQNQPPWVGEWKEKREKKQAAKQQATEPVDEATQAKRVKQGAKRVAGRQERVGRGLDDLALWLRDLIRQGLGNAQSKPRRFWEDAAARLVDAQAPGVARLVRELGTIPASGEGWAERLLEKVGLLHLLIEGYSRIATLPPATQADLRALVGWTQEQAELSDYDAVDDQWMVLGQQVADEDRFVTERTWLQGRSSGRTALVLHFAPHQQPTRSGLVVGTSCKGRCVFYPSSYPLRAHIEATEIWRPSDQPPTARYQSLAALLAAYAAALARLPWLERFPALLDEITVLRHGERWVVRDVTGKALPIREHFQDGWKLMALSAGQPITLFGEWDGGELLPLSVWVDGQLWPLGGA